ncbi:MAG TPA: hypothetical protein VF546_24100 [Pyrinomonadaceae bacterium]|jgi:nucleoid-associated protein YgaU
MPVKPDSRFAKLPVLRVRAPDGTVRAVVALRLVPDTPPGARARHRVGAGEELDQLARRFYGNERLWWRILDANPVVYPLDIKPGDELTLPPAGAATRTTRARKF